MAVLFCQGIDETALTVDLLHIPLLAFSISAGTMALFVLILFKSFWTPCVDIDILGMSLWGDGKMFGTCMEPSLANTDKNWSLRTEG